MSDQHDDHIWFVVNGKSWAVKAIERGIYDTILYLWRGYGPDIEYCIVICDDSRWDEYCEAAVALLEQGAKHAD